METVDEGSSRFGMYKTKEEFSMDLKLGQVGNVGIESMLYKPKDAAFGAGLSKIESKRARAFKNGNHRVTCLVDGCKADISNCRDNYRRHKVCELHSKTSQTHNTHGNGLNQMVQPHSSSLIQPLGLSLHDNNSLETVDSLLNPNGSDVPQLFPFQWE